MAARLARLQREADEHLAADYFSAVNESQSSFDVETAAATKIQALARGVLARAAFRRYVTASTTLQSGARGMAGRARARRAREERERAERAAFFNRCATEIQRRWRGHHSRRHTHDFYARKKFIAAALKASEELRVEIARELAKQSEDRELQAQLEFTQKFQKNIKGKHHLISTRARPGIYNSPYAEFNGGKPQVGGKDLESHLRDTLRGLAKTRPDEKKQEQELGQGGITMTIEKPQFYTAVKKEYLFDDYSAKQRVQSHKPKSDPSPRR